MTGAEVRAFDELTIRGRISRLRGLALDALREYDLEVEHCSFAGRAFNTVFRIGTTDGSSYALRVSPSLRIPPTVARSSKRPGSRRCDATPGCRFRR